MGGKMGFVIGFILMLILVALSSIPIFIVGHIKKQYSKGVAWFLTILCIIVYIFLKVLCQEYDILDKNSHTVPAIAMFLIYGISNYYVKTEEKQNYTTSNYDNGIKILDKYKNELVNINIFKSLVVEKIENTLKRNKTDLNNNKMFNDNKRLEQFIVAMISNYSGDFLESGQYHIYRGVLAPEGKELMQLYDYSMNKLIELNAIAPDGNIIDNNYVNSQKEILINNLKTVG